MPGTPERDRPDRRGALPRPEPEPAPWWRRRRTLTVAGVGAVVLVLCGYLALGTGWGSIRYLTERCADRVWERGPDDECTGVSDGGFVFGDLDDISAAIAKENRRVTDGSLPYVTVALLIPLTTAEADPNRRAAVKGQIRHEVQGAHLAQLRMNGRGSPAVRLVLANPGRGSAHYAAVAEELDAMARSKEENLRAVVGFDMSEENTKKAIRHLTADLGIPVVGGPITASDLTMPGLARIVPTNEDQAEVLAGLPDGDNVFLVEDTRPGDSYVDTLRDAFNAKRPKGALESEQYRSSGGSDDDPSLAGDFENIAQNICQSGARDIYFAGRPPQLRMLVLELGSQPCARTKHSFRVITGSGASTVDSYVPSGELDEWRRALGRVTVEYAAVGHPEAWAGSEAPEAEDARTEMRHLEAAAAGLKGADLEDSRLMTIYDATRTAVTNIRRQAEGGKRIPRLDEVASGWHQLKSVNKIRGTTGWICLDNHGNAYNKAVHRVRLDPKWRPNQKLDFVGVSWPEGEPLDATCTAPRR
ncbi:ABC transporter substrate-binding protein [Streptomyces sp. Da 82-17]|uniref:ABC transporter substrate-binding protein n=1 Tax=Streptomyces sp. Da 82-17 TaxID=3377116 RepID=UPI0038D3D330